MDPNPPMDDPYCPLGKQRVFLQWYGTEFRRSVNQDYWVNQVAEQIKEDQPDVALISDLRFMNEMQWVQRFGECVRIDRPGVPHSAHESEKALAHIPDECWSDIIKNNGTLDEFKEKVLFSFDMLLSAVPQEHRTEEPKGTVVRV
jgi:hypothetical protein